MQKIATKIFIYASIAFGILGILMILAGGPDVTGPGLNMTLHKLILVDVFIILPSFALSVASKYLSNKS